MNSWHGTEDIQYTVSTQHYICAFEIPPDALAGLHCVPSKLAAWVILGWQIQRLNEPTYTLCPGIQTFPSSPWSSLRTAPSPAESIAFNEKKRAHLGRGHVNTFFSGIATRRSNEHMDYRELKQDCFATTSWCYVDKGRGKEETGYVTVTIPIAPDRLTAHNLAKSSCTQG